MKDKMSLRDFASAKDRRQFLEQQLKVNLEQIGKFTFPEEMVAGRNIENLIGATQIPLGIAGPLKLRTTNYELRTHYIPLATTEGALIASLSRGCKAINESGGAIVEVQNVGMTRGPVFKTQGIKHSIKVQNWINKNFKVLSAICQKTSSHLKLLKIDFAVTGRNLFARFYFDTQDAMGMNMATIATSSAVKLIAKETKATCVAVAGNYDIDKKPAWLNFISGRGKKVWAEVVLKRKVIKSILKTTPEKIAEVVFRKIHIGSEMSGSLGFNAHYANIIAAIFAATGQDLAHVVEGSLGITTAEVSKDDLYFSIYLPALLCGTVGGGTHLPTQKEALSIMGIKEGEVNKYAQILGSAILAGEISLIASLAEESLTKAHQKLGRGKKI